MNQDNFHAIFDRVLLQLNSNDECANEDWNLLLINVLDDEKLTYLKESVVALAGHFYADKNIMLLISIIIAKVAFDPFKDKIFSCFEGQYYVKKGIDCSKLFFYISKTIRNEAYQTNIQRIVETIEDVSEELNIEEVIHPKYLFILSEISPYDLHGGKYQFIDMAKLMKEYSYTKIIYWYMHESEPTVKIECDGWYIEIDGYEKETIVDFMRDVLPAYF